jgi:mercuric ion transport protein
MKNNTMLGVGIAGFVIAALCCATPALVLLLGAVGFSALTGHLDYVLLPALVLFAGVIAFAMYRRRGAQACCAPEIGDGPGARPHLPLASQDQESPR